MDHQNMVTRDQALWDLMTKTPTTYQKRLALAHHLKMTGNNPNLSNRFGPLEQKAGAQLAAAKYPMSLELAAQMKAGQFDPVKQLNRATPPPPQGNGKLSQPDEQETNQPETPQERAQGQAGFDQMRESFPRLTPPTPALKELLSVSLGNLHFNRVARPSKDGEEMNQPETIDEKVEGEAAFDQMRRSFPRMTPRKASSTSRRDIPTAALLRMRRGSTKLILAGAAIAGLLGLAVFFRVGRPYNGVLSDIKVERSGVILDLDGRYPAEKMSVWVTKNACVQLHGHWPQVGAHLEVIGKRSSYRGRPEIVVIDSSQLVCQ
jgi:hypothetical protein